MSIKACLPYLLGHSLLYFSPGLVFFLIFSLLAIHHVFMTRPLLQRLFLTQNIFAIFITRPSELCFAYPVPELWTREKQTDTVLFYTNSSAMESTDALVLNVGTWIDEHQLILPVRTVLLWTFTLFAFYFDISDLLYPVFRSFGLNISTASPGRQKR